LYADDVSIMGGGGTVIIKKNTKVSLDANKEVGLEVNQERTKYMLVSRSQKTGQNYSIKTANRSF
jgi:hypothetical protein